MVRGAIRGDEIGIRCDTCAPNHLVLRPRPERDSAESRGPHRLKHASMGGDWKIELIEKENPTWRDLFADVVNGFEW